MNTNFKPKHLYILFLLILLSYSVNAFNGTNIVGKQGFVTTQGTTNGITYSIGGYYEPTFNTSIQTIESCHGFYCLQVNVVPITPPGGGGGIIGLQLEQLGADTFLINGDEYIMALIDGGTYLIRKIDFNTLQVRRLLEALFILIIIISFIIFIVKQRKKKEKTKEE